MAKEERRDDSSIYTPDERKALGGRFATTWSGKISILVIMLFVAFIGIWIFTSMVAQAKQPPSWQELVHLQRYFKGFHMAGVTMGMTPEMVQSLHPKLTLLSEERRRFRGTFVAEQTPYTIWFADLDGAPRAYRVRYHRRYPGGDENEALNVYGRKLGRPLSTSCTRSQLTASAKTCVFKWLRNGVEVIMTSKLIRLVGAGMQTYVTVTATDVLSDSTVRKNLRARPPIQPTLQSTVQSALR